MLSLGDDILRNIESDFIEHSEADVVTVRSLRKRKISSNLYNSEVLFRSAVFPSLNNRPLQIRDSYDIVIDVTKSQSQFVYVLSCRLTHFNEVKSGAYALEHVFIDSSSCDVTKNDKASRGASHKSSIQEMYSDGLLYLESNMLVSLRF